MYYVLLRSIIMRWIADFEILKLDKANTLRLHDTLHKHRNSSYKNKTVLGLTLCVCLSFPLAFQMVRIPCDVWWKPQLFYSSRKSLEDATVVETLV